MKRTQRSRRSPRASIFQPTRRWLPNFSELVDNEQSNKPFSLSALLLHHNLQPDKWESSGDDKSESLRASCLAAEGVHQVWQNMAGDHTYFRTIFSFFHRQNLLRKRNLKLIIRYFQTTFCNQTS